MNTSIDFFDLFISGVLICSFFTNKMFPYIQNEKPITMGNNDLKLIKFNPLSLSQALMLMFLQRLQSVIPKQLKLSL